VIEVAIVRPGPDPGRHGAPLPAAAPGRGAGRLPTDALRAGAGAHAGRADLPGAGDADRHAGGRLHAPARPTQLRRAMAAWKRKGGLHQFHDRLVAAACTPSGYTRRVRREHLQARSKASANTASPRATPPASPSWSTSAPGSRRHRTGLLPGRPHQLAAHRASTPRTTGARRPAPRRHRAARRRQPQRLGLSIWGQIPIISARPGRRLE